jgi:hypothetical protein
MTRIQNLHVTLACGKAEEKGFPTVRLSLWARSSLTNCSFTGGILGVPQQVRMGKFG